MKGAEVEIVFAAIARSGLVPRGALLLEESERTGALADIRTIVLSGMAGREGWDAFAASPEASDGLADPLDRWSRRMIEALARELGGRALFPFGGPPFCRSSNGRAGRSLSILRRSKSSSTRTTGSGILIAARLGLEKRWPTGAGRNSESVRFLPRALVLESLSGRSVLKRRL